MAPVRNRLLPRRPRRAWRSSFPAVSPPSYRRIVPGRNEPCPCGSTLKYKKCCLAGDEDAHRGSGWTHRPGNRLTPAEPARDRRLHVTMTNEPFQPVRLYYAVVDRARVIGKLAELRCVVEAPSERCWQWLFHAETASLRFLGGGHDDVPEHRRPIVLGRIRFPAHRIMTLETNSIERAIAGARFFAPRFGPAAVAMRCRLVNRYFVAHEGQPDQLMATLDHDVTVIDPRVAEAALEHDLAGVQSLQDADRVLAESLEQRLKSKDDVPMVEDFPLAPEEETPELTHLATALQFRFVRALEHWRGNTDLTLAAIILRTVQQGMRDGAISTNHEVPPTGRDTVRGRNDARPR